MLPHMVVEESEFAERKIERFEGIDREPIELFLQCPEEALDTPVLPRAAGIGSLMTNAEQEERKAEAIVVLVRERRRCYRACDIPRRAPLSAGTDGSTPRRR